MQNLTWGITTVALSAIGYYFAWYSFKKGRTKAAVLLLVVCGFMLRLYTATDLYLHEWDERYHALVAKNLGGDPLKPVLYSNPVLPFDYKDWTGNHVWLHKQPFPLWIMAASMKIFGVNEIALRLPSLFLSTLGILLMFSVARRWYGNTVAFFAAFLFSIHGMILELTGGRVATDHVDVFFLVLILASVYFILKFSEQQKTYLNVIAGFLLGCAILTKWLAAFTALPLYLLVLFYSHRFSLKELIIHFMVFLVICVLVFLPWQLYIFHVFPKEAAWESNYNFRHITEVLEKHDHSLFFHFDVLRIAYGELVYVPVIFFTWHFFRKKKWYPHGVIMIWFWVVFLFFTYARTKMQAYTLFAAPAIFIMIAWTFVYFTRLARRSRYRKTIYVITALLLLLPVRYTLERMKPFADVDRTPGWVQHIKQMGEKYKNTRLVVINAKRPVEIMFYTNAIAYPYQPEPEVLSRLEKEGYTVIDARKYLSE